ncbi:MAG: alpha/beta hydrolase [Pegethrix bostrychoides GSE-TBD4-15B]|jgi:predicted dienelactone hydrolase|uniref:Alpha/beta hydrolase n=1 Tax=Pegethrix bostrychoides GSE-TBD4-15B TaxID=2839662 RepID=A0A951P7Z8_9CYAN|nr:alpha/beta hydrolase [Pegethrix bostrychoides GSE-TBD4-15B]
MSQPSRASLRFGSRYGLQRAVCQFTLRLLLGLSLTLLLAWPTLLALPIQAAERIYFSFGLLERSISVASLEAYAETGQVGSDLARFLNFLTPEQQVELRTALTVSHQLSPVAVSQSFYEPMGEQVLSYIGNLIQTGKRQNGLFALRSALILAAGQPGGFTLLDVLHQFPTRGIRFDLKVALEALRQGERFFNQTNAVIDGIEQLAQQSQPSTPLDISDLPDLRQPGTVAFSKQSFTLTDASRNHSFPVDLYLPQFSSPQFSSERVPVVVLSHGLGSSRADFADVAEHFASYGFAVAMPQHVNSDFELQQAVLAGRASELFRVSEFVDRPKDVSFLLDALEQRNQTEWQNRLDLQQVAAIGHSFGGYTALALGGATVDFDNLRQNCSRSTFTASFNPSLLLQCRALEANPADREQLAAGLGDPRVKLVIAFNPVNAYIFGAKGLGKIQVPIVMGGSGYDPAAPLVPEQATAFVWLTSPEKYLLLARGGAHIPQLTALINRFLSPGIDADQLAEEIELFRSNARALMLAFLEVYLANSDTFERYLQPFNVETLGDPPFTFSLIHELREADLAQMLRAGSR